MKRLLHNLADSIANVNLVFGGSNLNLTSIDSDLIEKRININSIEIPTFRDDRENLRSDRNRVSESYSNAVASKLAELELK